MATHVCYSPMMARARTPRRGARRCGLKGEPIALPGRRLAGAALPTVQDERLRANEFHVDPEIAHIPARRRVEPAQELAQAVAVRDDVHRRPVDRGLLVIIYCICSGEEGKHRILGHPGPVLVHKVGAAIGLQGEWDTTPGPYSWRTCISGIRQL